MTLFGLNFAIFYIKVMDFQHVGKKIRLRFYSCVGILGKRSNYYWNNLIVPLTIEIQRLSRLCVIFHPFHPHFLFVKSNIFSLFIKKINNKKCRVSFSSGIFLFTRKTFIHDCTAILSIVFYLFHLLRLIGPLYFQFFLTSCWSVSRF